MSPRCFELQDPQSGENGSNRAIRRLKWQIQNDWLGESLESIEVVQRTEVRAYRVPEEGQERERRGDKNGISIRLWEITRANRAQNANPQPHPAQVDWIPAFVCLIGLGFPRPWRLRNSKGEVEAQGGSQCSPRWISWSRGQVATLSWLRRSSPKPSSTRVVPPHPSPPASALQESPSAALATTPAPSSSSRLETNRVPYSFFILTITHNDSRNWSRHCDHLIVECLSLSSNIGAQIAIAGKPCPINEIDPTLHAPLILYVCFSYNLEFI